MPHQTPTRLPAFAAVPSRHRHDGWTPPRQAEFLGRLAESGSVSAAAAAVGMSRESAYRLRRRAGDDSSFALVWGAALGRVRDLPPKVTPEELAARALGGVWRPVLRGGRHLAAVRKPDNSALLVLLARLDRASRGESDRVRGAEGHSGRKRR